VRVGPCGGVNVADVVTTMKGANFLANAATISRVLAALSIKEESDNEEEASSSSYSSSDSSDSLEELRRRAKRRRVILGDAWAALKALKVLRETEEGPTDMDRKEVARIAREALRE
jgi:U3 small nucleolar ribonucleoprotein component